MFRTWFRRMAARQAQSQTTGRRRPSRCRLHLESLEDRRLLTFTLSPVDIAATEGEANTGVLVGRISSSDLIATAAGFTASVVWNDGSGQTTPGTVTETTTPPGTLPHTFDVRANHTFPEESGSNAFGVQVTVAQTVPAAPAQTVTDNASVADAILNAGNPVTATHTEFSGTGGTNTTGGTKTALTAFETAIGGVDNGGAPPAQATGFRTINWDGVKLDGTDFGGPPNTTVITQGKTIGIPLNRFQARGVFFEQVYAVSGDGFVDVNPGVGAPNPVLFPAFSPANTFAMFNDNTIDFSFVVPSGTTTTVANAASRGFGAVFLNVEKPNTTSIEYFNGNVSLGKFFAPVGGKGQASFLGELFDKAVVTKVTITLGTDALFRFDGTTASSSGVVDDATHNLVVTDDFAYPEPVPLANGLPIVSGPAGLDVAVPTLTAFAGKPFTGVAATFSDADPGANAKDFTAVINWGDGHSSNGTVTASGSGGFNVTGTNTYAAAGVFPVNVDVQDFGGSSVAVNNTVRVLALSATPTPFNATEGLANTNVQVATFTDNDPTLTTANLTATIDWGDGTTTAGTITAGSTAGTFNVSGTHTYAEEGAFIAGKLPVTVTITDTKNSLAAMANSTANVADAPLSPGNPVTAGTPVTFSAVGTTDVTTALKNLETSIGGADNSTGPAAPQASGFRTINWDGVKLDGTDFGGGSNTTVISNGNTVGIPLNRFQARGVFFGAVYGVSGDQFASVTNNGTTGLFPPFSQKNVFAMFNNNVINVRFVAPSANSAQVPAATRGFGAIFVNVLTANTTSIEFFNGNTSLGKIFAPVGAAGTPEFVGELFSSPIITNVKLTLGDGVLFKFDGTTTSPGDTDVSKGGTKNLVVTDDWAYAEPVPIANGFGNIIPPLAGTGAPLITSGTPGTANAPFEFTANVGKAFTGVVATFSDADPNANAKDYTARIVWGDGHESVGTVTANGNGGFDVTGTNTYAKPGTFPVSVDVAEFGGSRLAISNVGRAAFATVNQRFVAQVYQDLLRRPVDDTGLAFWSGLLDTKALTPGQVVRGIENSQEYEILVVQDAFQKYLGRLADPDGLNFFVSILQNPPVAFLISLEQTFHQQPVDEFIQSQILGSPEYFQKHGGTVQGVLDALYQDVLHRAVDANGQAFFGGELAAGVPTGTVALQLLTTPEAYQNVVQDYFQRFLGRAADAGGRDFFVGAFTFANARDEDVIAAILSSQEYINKATAL